MDNYALIKEVHKREAIWNQKNKNHHNRYVLDKVWDEIAVKFNLNRLVVRNKWKAMRDKYRTILVAMMLGGESKPTITWPYFDYLTFLKDQFNLKKIKENYTTEDTPSFNAECKSEIDIVECDRMDSPATSMYAIESPSTYEDIHNSTDAEDTSNHGQKRHHNEAYEEYNVKRSKEDEDDDLTFFKSVIPHIKNLSSFEKMSYRVKILIVTQEFVKECKKKEDADPLL